MVRAAGSSSDAKNSKGVPCKVSGIHFTPVKSHVYKQI